MTDTTRSAAGSEGPWVIRRRGYFYRANHQGYTSEICAAGRYSREEAERVGNAGIGATAHPLSEFITGRHPDGEKCFECCEPLSVVCLKCNPEISNLRALKKSSPASPPEGSTAAVRREKLRAALRALDELARCLLQDEWMRECVAVDAAKDELTDHFDRDYCGRCGQCEKALLFGDEGHMCLDGDPILCADHAMTWADVRESYEVDGGVRDSDPELYETFVARCLAHLMAGGVLADKLLITL